jgi:ACR3 family arsenite transporter
VPVLLALVNVALYFQRKYDWVGGASEQLDGATVTPGTDDD